MAGSCVTIHMAASLDGFIARKDGSVDWMEVADEYPAGDTMDPEYVTAFLKTIDCYVMGSRTYQTALGFESKGMGWVYGDKPVFVLTSRTFPQARASVEFRSGELRRILDELRARFSGIWVVGGGSLCGEILRQRLADEVRFSILPVAIGDGIAFFQGLDHAVSLHLLEVKAYRSGMVALRHAVQKMESRTS